MVRRNPHMSFGGTWTFPGGVLEHVDGPLPAGEIDEATFNWHDLALLQTAAQGAVRETREETGLVCAPASLAWFSHWIPPKQGPPKRFATWFFLCAEHTGTLIVDPQENSEGIWVSPSEALRRSTDGAFPLSVPTWVTLDDLRAFDNVASVLDTTITQGARIHHTRAAKAGSNRVLLWEADAGYAATAPDTPGARDRAVVSSDFAVLERVRTRPE